MSALGPRDPSLACLQSRKNGRLQLAGFGLVAVPEEALDPFSHLRGNELSQYVELCTRANLEDNEIETLPANIGGLGGALAQLQLRNNKIETLPAALSDLPGLKTLSVENNRLSVIEEKLSLPHLTTLSIQNNLLKFLPDDLFDGLSVCSKLTCADNQIAALPTSLRRAKHLRVLDLSRNKLTTISGLEGATSLESIFVSQNLLEDLQGLEYLEHLTELDASCNRLSTWPTLPKDNGVMMKIVLNDNRAIDHVNGDDLMAMRATLKELHLARLSLTELPSEVAGLPKLRLLNIENNDLKDIPGALGHLSELSTLIVAGNPIRRKRIDFNNSTAELKKYLATKDTPHPSIIEDLGGGRNAATEALSRTLRDAAHYGTLTLAAPTGNSKKGGAAKGGDVLTEFPLAILEPKVANELTELVVTGHALTTLPTDKLRNLTRICHISLEGNCLGSAGGSGGGGGGGGGASMDPPLFAALLGLERLVSLKMKGNSLSDDDIAPLAGAPAEKKWPSLQEVDLSFNKLGSFPLILIEKSPKLRTLLLSNNQMSGDIEDEIPLLFLLPELMTIDLSENKLTSTGQFRFMKTLTNMNFEKNELRQCPPELGLLKLIYLGVAQNPLRGISADTLNGGTTKLLRYLENKLPKGWEEPAWVELARAGKSADGEPLSVAPPAPIHRTESGRRGARFFSSKTPEGQAAAAEGGGSNEVSLSARVNLEEKLSVVLKEIAKYSEELESKGNMSAAVAHATKKKLSVKKAEKLRIERQIKEL